MRSFNANFYITTATVIPVLYLALTLQGTMFEGLMANWLTTKDYPSKFWPQVRAIATALVAIFAGGITLYGVYAEFLAIRALYTQSSNSQNEHTVYLATVYLLIIAAAGPGARFVTAYFGSLGMLDWTKKMRKRPTKNSASDTPGDHED